MKVCVYAICKNEEKFALRWVKSMSEADKIFVLDTGSSDNTVKLLNDRGVIVKKEIINPWRFDVARNKSLEMVDDDTDICVCTDLDEVFLSGWRKKLEDNYKTGYRVNYTYNWHINDDGRADVSFYLNNIHPRNNYYWVHPVHEVLTCKHQEKVINIMDIILNHYPDTSKSRSSYLELLELSIKEDPFDDRNMHYLGREYMYYGRYKECIKILKRHLNLETAKWNLERSASMRFIGRSYYNIGNLKEAEKWYKKSINEAPNLRDGYVELGIMYNSQNKWLDSINILIKALMIKNKEMVYMNEIFSWDNTIYDILSINYFNIGLYEESLFYVNKALEYDLKNERLLNNKKIIEMNKNV